MTPKDTVKNFIENVLNQYKFDEIDVYIAPKFQSHSMHINPKPVNIDNPPKTFKEALIQSQKSLSEFKRTIEEIISTEDKVVVRWTTEAIQIGAFMGIPPTNQKIKFSGISIYRVVENKITDEWYVWDRLGLYEELNLMNK